MEMVVNKARLAEVSENQETVIKLKNKTNEMKS